MYECFINLVVGGVGVGGVSDNSWVGKNNIMLIIAKLPTLDCGGRGREGTAEDKSVRSYWPSG